MQFRHTGAEGPYVMPLLHLHPTKDLLEKYSLRSIGAGEEEYVDEHLLICELCRLRLEKVDGDIEALRAVLRASFA